MAMNSDIGWTDDTVNLWWGCFGVSPACDHCYAKGHGARLGRKVAKTLGITGFETGVRWGSHEPRLYRVARAMDELDALHRKAQRAKRMRNVFINSMSDLFEGREEQEPHLRRLWEKIEHTPWLRYLLLTKRPQSIESLTPWPSNGWPPNVWVGATIESQKYAEARLNHLLKVPSIIRFVSAEPLLGSLDLSRYLGTGKGRINWLITGGESGVSARGCGEMLNWYRSLRDQCLSVYVPFFFKQWGMFAQGGNYPDQVGDSTEKLYKLWPKRNNDNRLDGHKWEQYPGCMILHPVDYTRPRPLTRFDKILSESHML